MKKEKKTYHDIAKMANVGIGTVSRYFNNYNISNEAKEKIKKVIDQSGYIPNYAAASIKKPNKDVYLLLPFNSEEKANMEIVNGVKSVLELKELNFFILLSSNDSKMYQDDLKTIILRNSYGLVLFLPKNTSKELITQIEEIKNSEIIVYNRHLKNIKSIDINDYEMFSQLAKKIDSLYKDMRITFIGLENHDITTGKIRTEAFIENIKKNTVSKWLIKNNLYEYVIEIMPEIVREDNSQIIVCATHTIALSVNTYLIQHNIRKKYIVTDVARFKNVKNTNDFDLTIEIDYFLVGKNIGNKLLKKEINLENIFKII
ncbi:LacI family DNA-binding transcriptional regulator [Spiroplasma diminutum]|uniref:Trehalose operon repressor n=1 Tax=Spiroplasma diminutum CUAS-1 TaxID=1276221 RepID=S5LWS9_9MOLU|nr:LacI family DNA-binding transcriptional regulator [Spiroplasma diminutum]AGR42219.1 trehalose operon repressor [Spiroplasma diminutum CUAS-1]